MTTREQTIRRWERATTWPLIGASFLFLILYSWLVLDPGMPRVLSALLLAVLGIVWIVFAADYVTRLVLSENKWAFVSHNLIDLASVLLPLARPFRMLKDLSRIPVLRGNSGTHLRRRVLIVAASFVVMFIYVISLAVYSVERNAPHASITSFGDSVWWACVTMATVGYGDYYPVTVPGRMFAVVLMIGGVGIVGTASATIVSYFNDQARQLRERREEEHHDDEHHDG
ncbi:potassium channel family protein [Leifsonia poae]|uniref:potassium channel family protein n=1 Tax=Leifsonia poae TaxID=110933 RepID=UPI001CBC02DF|nr:potassium channel family protein [Leifsonia poae]